MGKGTIISGGTDGVYTLQLNLNTANLADIIARMQAEIAVLDSQITTVSGQITTKQAESLVLENLITSYIGDPTKTQELKTASKNLVVKQNELYELRMTKKVYELQKKALQLRIAYYNANTPEDPTAPAYCVDLTEDLTGVVGTIEIPGERGSVRIRPGYNGRATYDRTRDGQLFPAICQNPFQCFYNWAMLPGWQKWLPKYKFGTILSIDYNNNICNIDVEAATSSAQDLDVNSSLYLEDVPIEYMN
jgi:hypothetical protein